MNDDQSEQPLLLAERPAEEGFTVNEAAQIGPAASHYRLYASHLLSTWNARQFEFAVSLLLLDIFPQTLLWTGLLGFCTTTAAILTSSSIGNLISSTGRLRIMQVTILLQRFAVCCAAVTLLVLPVMPREYKWMGFLVLVAFSVAEKLCAIGNMIAIERDWVIVISQATNTELSTLNSSMRRIDLVCALVSPMLTSLFTTNLSTRDATLVVLGTSIVSPIFEYYLIYKVYHETPELAQRAVTTSEQVSERHLSSTRSEPSILQSYKIYAKSSIFLPSMALSFLYLTVLSFGAPMVAYLKIEGYSDGMIAAMRSLSVLVGLLATFAAPRVIKRVGLERSGLWSLWSQALSLIPVALTFYRDFSTQPLMKLVYLFGFLSLSRLGLWGYDLTGKCCPNARDCD